jgi:hypothetical protein
VNCCERSATPFKNPAMEPVFFLLLSLVVEQGFIVFGFMPGSLLRADDSDLAAESI